MRKMIEVELKGIELVGVQEVQVNKFGRATPMNVVLFGSNEEARQYVNKSIQQLKDYYGYGENSVVEVKEENPITNIWRVHVEYHDELDEDKFEIIYKVSNAYLQ